MGMIITYLAGWHCRGAVAAWTDHADQRAKERRLRKARWVAWQATLWPIAGIGVVLVVVAKAGSGR
jgi:hypothetical protein